MHLVNSTEYGTVVTCDLPEGTGRFREIEAELDGEKSELVYLVSYAGPTITQLQHPKCSFSGTEASSCAREGGGLLTYVSFKRSI